MRRGTAIALVVLLTLLLATAIVQLVMASGDRQPLPGPTSVGQLPSRNPTA
jgi:hypothetical protein